MTLEFESLGYQVQYKVLNACYYGVGQKRERLIVIGIRNDLVQTVHFEYSTPEKNGPLCVMYLKMCLIVRIRHIAKTNAVLWSWFLRAVVG